MSQNRPKVVRLGVPFPDPEYEQRIVGEAGGELVMALPKGNEETFAAIADASVIINAVGFPFDADAMARIPSCRAIIQSSVGYDRIDVAAATNRDLMIANLPDYCIEEVSDHAVSLVLSLARRLPQMDRIVRAGQWGQPGVRTMDLCGPIDRLRERTLGIIGFGNIGRLVARKTGGIFGRLITADPYVKPEVATQHGAELLSLEDVLRQSDYVTLHVLLTDSTRHLMDASRLALMKPSAYLVNTCRGPVVDEVALLAALREGKLAGAGLDVFEKEPIGADHPLVKQDNVILTPHLAVFSRTAMDHWRTDPIEDAARILRGFYPRGLINRELKARLQLQEP